MKIASPLILLQLAIEGAFTPTTIDNNRLAVLALRGGGDVSGRPMLQSKNQVCDLCTFEELKKPVKRGKEKSKYSSDMLQRRILDDFYLMDFVRFQDPESPLDRISSDRNGKKGCQTFSNLADATKFLSQRDDPKNMMFAREVNVNGARVFMVGSFDEFWELYLNYPHTRHFYEVILENSPCKLYMDLEFKMSGNESFEESCSRGNQLVEEIKSNIVEVGRKLYNREICEKRDFLELDSTTREKFSRHLISGNLCFQNNIQLGSFIQILSKQLQDDAKNLIDMGVYSRNRCFRLLYSTKFGRNNSFGFSDRCLEDVFNNQTRLNDFDWMSRSNNPDCRKAFLTSMASIVPDNEEVLHVDENMLRDLLNSSSLERKFLHDKDEVWNFKVGGGGPGGGRGGGANSLPTSLKPLGKLVCEKIRPGAVIKWRNDGYVIFSLQGNRYCENIQRQHKANGIVIVVHLESGTWWQKCQDPECRSINFRSPKYSIEPAVLQVVLAAERRYDYSSSSPSE
ncbi:hypothetical protein GUITHDRAFT_115788 [Guillardia theta CCMP2712]|uniref:DNA-directed primase/polymerase protein n=1 Tax=Guillardia theta (strain CCMP2712) TaxID=905079 RepID=L1IQC0_GUITC|nr:hypothetical protein GUITHDRAFT_115788 [Guillardia theta CCMP2712]EKX38025.1 hypothetical protein GUITHDRAFT_115788 [Guillardia theta CCMP2712]|eukprot:XP_005825005.1 hypothetical protein GUITHDRAFT_115788 [Guillardia theta CCMP2712]